MSYRTAARLLGQLLVFLGAAEVAPALIGLAYGEDSSVLAYLIGATITAVLGFTLMRFGRGSDQTIHRRDALLVVAGGWVAAGLSGAICFYLDTAVPTYTDGFFETISGFTTTGSTILTQVDPATGLFDISHASLFWRSMTHWLGGMGIIVLFVAIFPQLGVGGKLLFRNEVPGPITEGLKPRIKETSAALWRIYLGITVVDMIALMACGMDLFDAANHAMATLATGGYSTRGASIAYYDSVSVDVVTTVFMLLAGVNFSLYYLIRRGRWKKAATDRELWTYMAIAVMATVIVALSIIERHGGIFEAFRYAAFQVAAIITTTGFGTDDFNQYPPMAKLVLVGLMFVGGCAGSTAGGIKIYRLMVVAKATWRELTHAFQPQLVRAIRVGGQVVPDAVVGTILAFFALFVGIWVTASIIIAAMGIDIVTSTTAVAATLGNIGPGLERVGSIENFAFIPVGGKWLLSACMILGRLEIVTVAALLVPSFWRR
ncbi:MAG: TrkH family potassium uptake protein [Deltaproteobacteria bacterium]|nr:MAG: TrkH family potassium uptake protein [Deltaproteobacteria bacterium]